VPGYLWTAETRNREKRNGEMEAAGVEAVEQRLKAQQLINIKVKKKPIQIVLRMPGSTGIGTKDLVVFTRQFSTMINAGLPLVQCLDILSKQLDNLELRKVLADVKERVEGGSTFADSLAKHPKVFEPLFVNLVAAGELGGVLDTILNRLAAYLEKNMKLVKQVKGAMTYPAVILVVSAAVVVVMLGFVIPMFGGMFAGMGASLPAPTQIMLDLSNLVRGNMLLIVIVLGGGGGGVFAALKTAKGQRLLDAALLKVPIFGPMIQKVTVARFTRTLGTMLSSGVSILDALEIVSKSIGNIIVAENLLVVRQKISEGKSMAGELAALPIFPSMVVQMIAVGEQTGAMDAMLNKIADFYDDEVDAAVGTMMGLLESAIMLVLCVVLGGIVIAMYLPVFTLAGAMK
jgi:type IV pilus assembly protein PilC